MDDLCNNCGERPKRAPRQRWCRECHNAWMRDNRRRHNELKEEQRLRANARSTANVYKRRGVLEPEPCADCSNDDLETMEMHHDDYSLPLKVTWLCAECHQLRTNIERELAA